MPDTPKSTEHNNRDPLTHEPGSHPLGTAAGSAAGAAAGAVLGSAIGGPAGLLVGGALGAIAGGAAGHSTAEKLNPTTGPGAHHNFRVHEAEPANDQER